MKRYTALGPAGLFIVGAWFALTFHGHGGDATVWQPPTESCTKVEFRWAKLKGTEMYLGHTVEELGPDGVCLSVPRKFLKRVRRWGRLQSRCVEGDTLTDWQGAVVGTPDPRPCQHEE